MKNTLLFCIILFLTAGCNSPAPDKASKPALSDTVKNNDSSFTWHYTTTQNQMTSQTEPVAYVNCPHLLNFDFPYEGGSTACLRLYYHEGANFVELYISKGHLIHDNSECANIRLKFDSNPPENQLFYFNKDGSVNEVALYGSVADSLIEKMKKAKKLLMEVTFYRDGGKIIDFNVEGLKWNFKSNPLNVKKAAKENNDITTPLFDRLKKEKKSTSDNGLSNELSVDGATVNTKESIDRVNNSVTIHCSYTNNNTDTKTAIIKVSFINANDEVTATKAVTLTCEGNAQVSADLTADIPVDNYKSYKVEIE